MFRLALRAARCVAVILAAAQLVGCSLVFSSSDRTRDYGRDAGGPLDAAVGLDAARPDTGPSRDAGAGVDAGPGPGVDAGPAADAGTELDAGPGMDAGMDAGVDAGVDAAVMLDGCVGTTWYRDSDMDTFGDPLATLVSCAAPAGYVADMRDCDDTTASIGPPATAFYRDADSDLHGVATDTMVACAAPAGYVPIGDDCDDTTASIHPGVTDTACDAVDSDCDGPDGAAQNASCAWNVCTAAGCDDPVALATAAYHNCAARRFTGHVYCWGANGTANQLGVLSSAVAEEHATPIQVLMTSAGAMPLADVTQMCGGIEYTCAVRRDGALVCWGAVPNNGDTTVHVYATGAGVLAYVEVACSAAHVCARRMNGTVACFGQNADGQLGRDPATLPSSPTLVDVALPGGVPARALAIGARTSCALGTDDVVNCWGGNGFGELGRGATTPASDRVPAPVTFPAGTAIAEIENAYYTTIARTTAGAVYSWGLASSYDILEGGEPPPTAQPTPFLAPAVTVDALYGGVGGWACASVGGELRCWGNDSGTGAMGRGLSVAGDTSMATATAVPIVGGLRLRVRAAGTAYARNGAPTSLGLGAHTCAILEDGHVYCWGANTHEQLGTAHPPCGAMCAMTVADCSACFVGTAVRVPRP